MHVFIMMYQTKVFMTRLHGEQVQLLSFDRYLSCENIQMFIGLSTKLWGGNLIQIIIIHQSWGAEKIPVCDVCSWHASIHKKTKQLS